MLRMRNITKTFNSGTVDERVALDHMDIISLLNLICT